MPKEATSEVPKNLVYLENGHIIGGYVVEWTEKYVALEEAYEIQESVRELSPEKQPLVRREIISRYGSIKIPQSDILLIRKYPHGL